MKYPAPSDSGPQGTSPAPHHTTVVGIGASAGGLSALRTFFGAVPPDNGLAWVVVVHLSPGHESHLAELLQPFVAMPVQQVMQSTVLEANRVYVIPPNANLEAIDTHLRLSELDDERHVRAPIDHFFRTLARTHDGHAVGVILTGTGSDGTLGLREIKDKGGLTIVQDPTEAEHDGMPQSAIMSGAVDSVLRLAAIPRAILDYVATEPNVESLAEPGAHQDQRTFLPQVFSLIHARTGRDFSRYRRSTILRRITRRMQLSRIEDPAAYLALLRDQPEELVALSDDMLITVTSFFRDPASFEVLQQHTLPRLLQDRDPDDEIRIWSVGCATGEEAYSLAMLLLEESERRESKFQFLIFATDLHERSLTRGREGFYPGDIEADVSPERLRRYFHKENGGYRIRKEVRERVTFAPHNLLSDPPFSRIDLLACRNVLIYLERDAQAAVLGLFHYALRRSGVLILGPSERVDVSELFRVEHKEAHLFRRRDVPSPDPVLPVFPFPRGSERRRAPVPTAADPRGYGALHLHILERHGPPSLLIGPDDRVLHVSGHAGRYLGHPNGELTASIYRLVREELRMPLRAALHTIRQQREPRRLDPLTVHIDGEAATVTLELRPIAEPDEDGFVLLLFDEREPAQLGPVPLHLVAPDGDTSGVSDVQRVTDERDVARRRLDSLVDQYEASEEEMRASNEELQSTNEELRSTMEELETSKEELQSMNEELQTVNQENRHRVGELAQLSADLQNLLTATDIATLFLDRSFRILRFTPKVSELFNVRTTDRGRPLSDLTSRLVDSTVLANAESVLETLVPTEHEIEDQDGRWYLTRTLPYRSVEDRIDGVVITFVDITARKHAERLRRETEERFRTAIENLLEPFAILSAIRDDVGEIVDFRTEYVNEEAARLTSIPRSELVGRRMSELVPDVRTTDLFTMAVQAASGETVSRQQHPVSLSTAAGGELRHVDLRVTRLGDGVAATWRDVTARARHLEELRAARDEAEEASIAKTRFLSTMSHELRTPLNAVLGFAELMRTEVVGEVNDTQRRYLGRIRACANHLISLINEVLSFSRTQAGREEVEVEEVDLGALAGDVIELLGPIAAAKGLDLRLDVAPTGVVVWTDSGKVRQILTNLVGNGIKYTRAGQVHVAVVEDDADVFVHVRDTGPGIDPAQQALVFEPFVQLDSSRTRVEGGTGLGLTICRTLAQLLGGEIFLVSQPGEGSTFSLRLPVAQPAGRT